jgi:hypothetical protein
VQTNLLSASIDYAETRRPAGGIANEPKNDECTALFGRRASNRRARHDHRLQLQSAVSGKICTTGDSAQWQSSPLLYAALGGHQAKDLGSGVQKCNSLNTVEGSEP